MIVNDSIQRLFTLGVLAALVACGGQPAPPATPAPEAPSVAPQPVTGASVTEAPPPPLPAQPLEFPPFEEQTLPNGLRMIVVEDHDQPLANVNLYVESGAAADPAAKAGLAGMVADLLTKGTPERSAEEIAETIERVGGDLSAFAGDDYISIQSSVLSDDLPLAFELVGDVATRPTFPEDEFEIARTRTLSGLQVALSQPGTIAQRRFAREVYGEEHPYGLAPLPETVEAIELADLRAFHDEHFQADNALLVVSGDVDPARVAALAAEAFGAWEGGGVPEAAFVEPPAREQAQVYLVHRPGSVQSNILVGHVGIRPDNPDYYPLQVLNKIVGGGTDSRLFLILREEKGWTYGAYSQLSRPEDVGYFRASAEVRTEVTDSALAEIMTQLRRIREEPVSAEELEAAKSFLVGSFPLRIQTPGQVASQVAQTRLLGLPVEALTEYRDRIGEVSIEDVQRVAREYIRPARASVVVVGDATQVMDDIEALGIGPITLTDVEGDPLDPAALEGRASTETFDASRLEPGTRTYGVMVQGNAMGTATSTLAQEGDVWVATSTLQGAMSQESEVRFGADFTPVSSTSSSAQGGAELQYADGRITGSAELPPQAGGDKTIDAEVVDGTFLPGMDEYALAVADLEEGKTITVPVFNVLTGGVSPVTYEVTGTETVEVAAGSFPSYRLEVSGGPIPLVIYVRQELPHVTVKQDIVGQPVSIELQSMEP